MTAPELNPLVARRRIITRRGALAAMSLALAASGLPASSQTPVAGPGPEISAPAAAHLNAQDAELLTAMLWQASVHGFEPSQFWDDDRQAPPGGQRTARDASAEAQLAAAAIAYARAQHGGRLPIAAFRSEWAIRPAAFDAATSFRSAAEQGRLADWIAALPPPDPRYGRLVAAYDRYRGLAAQGGWPVLAASPALKAGATGQRVATLRQRLAIEDPAAPAASPDEAAQPGADVYDAALAAAVTRAQARYGLEPDGVAGPKTLAALNLPADQRLAQIRANLERWRWVPRDLPAYRVELNIADASLVLHDPGAADLAMRAIVGRPANRTPMFEDQISAVVLNPPWNVPAKIAAQEIWPKIRRDPGYMARQGFVVRQGGGLQQRPGPDCALGVIKFDLSNPFGVYLHDTPARSLFAGDARALSHGCMRLEKPAALAKRLLANDPAWTSLRIELALATGKTVRAPVDPPVPLFVFYWTVFVDDQGQTQFRSDLYHWDAALLDLL